MKTRRRHRGRLKQTRKCAGKVLTLSSNEVKIEAYANEFSLSLSLIFQLIRRLAFFRIDEHFEADPVML